MHMHMAYYRICHIICRCHACIHTHTYIRTYIHIHIYITYYTYTRPSARHAPLAAYAAPMNGYISHAHEHTRVGSYLESKVGVP